MRSRLVTQATPARATRQLKRQLGHLLGPQPEVAVSWCVCSSHSQGVRAAPEALTVSARGAWQQLPACALPTEQTHSTTPGAARQSAASISSQQQQAWAPATEAVRCAAGAAERD